MLLIAIVLCLGCFSSCYERKQFSKTTHITDEYFNGDVIVEKIEKLNKFRITITNTKTGNSDRIYTPYEIFEMETGDVNNDGRTDICIGIIKPTPFDPVLKKRLFIFQIDRDYIRPLWLSSRLAHQFEKFEVREETNGKCFIKTLEKRTNDLYCVNEYRWESFGMSFVKINADSLTYSKAKSILSNQ